MPYEIFLAFRYLRSRRRRRLARVTACLAILGIAFGVAALIVALALGNGFRDELRDKILRGTAPIQIADGVTAHPLPGHTKGSVLYLADGGLVADLQGPSESAVLDLMKEVSQ